MSVRCALLASCALTCALLASCALPGGRSSTDAELFRKIHSLEAEAAAAGQANASAAQTCPVSIADLSASGDGKSLAYMCLSEQQKGGMAPGSDTGTAAGSAPPVMPAPCPPDAHLYTVEAGDRLIALARVIARPGEDWRTWAGAIRMRNSRCFDEAHALRSGCELIIPAVGEHKLAAEFAALWRQKIQLADSSLLDTCRRLWESSDS